MEEGSYFAISFKVALIANCKWWTERLWRSGTAIQPDRSLYKHAFVKC